MRLGVGASTIAEMRSYRSEYFLFFFLRLRYRYSNIGKRSTRWLFLLNTPIDILLIASRSWWKELFLALFFFIITFLTSSFVNSIRKISNLCRVMSDIIVKISALIRSNVEKKNGRVMSYLTYSRQQLFVQIVLTNFSFVGYDVKYSIFVNLLFI